MNADRQWTFSRRSFCSVFGLVIGGIVAWSVAAAEPTWKAGVARICITPEAGLWMAGYGFRDHPAEGKLQDLWAKALVLEDATGQQAVILTADFLGFNRPLGEWVSEKITSLYGIPRERILLGCSHTHCGPVIEGALYDIYPLDEAQKERIRRYTEWLRERLVEVVGEARTKLEPVQIFAGEGEAYFAVNRRNNREADVPKLRDEGKPLAGPSDYRVPVLAVRRVDGSLRSVLFQYACHNTVLGIYQWHGDYAGCAQEALEKKWPGAVVLFCIGCGADQNALPRRTVELAEAYGQQLAEAVGRVLEGPMRPVTPRLRASFEQIELKYEVVDRSYLEQAAKQGGYVARWASRLLEAIDRGESFSDSYPYPVQVWLLGEDQWWISLGGEVVVDYALRLGERYGKSTWVTGYANDVMAYIPSARVWEEGGYESGAFAVYGLPAKRWAADIENRILEAIERGRQNCLQQSPEGKVVP